MSCLHSVTDQLTKYPAFTPIKTILIILAFSARKKGITTLSDGNDQFFHAIKNIHYSFDLLVNIYNGNAKRMQQFWWYKDHNTYKTYYMRSKSDLLLKLLTNHPFIYNYKYIWFIDNDLQIPNSILLNYFIQKSIEYDAVISSPVLQNSPHDIMHGNDDCKIYVSNFIEIQAPFIKIEALYHIFSHLYNIEANSDWGLDDVWCAFVEEKMKHTNPCILVNVPFIHPLTPIAAFYGGIRYAQKDQACMRERFPQYVSEPRRRTCLETTEHNEFPKLSVNRPLKSVYIYDITDINNDHKACNTNSKNFAWELALHDVIKRTYKVVTHPEKADFFYLPACLSILWENHWKWEGTRLLSCVYCIKKYENDLIQRMHTVGKYHIKQAHLHLVPRLRCPRYPEEIDWVFRDIYTTLWQSSIFKYACIETKSLSPSMRAYNRELHLPYYSTFKKSLDTKSHKISFIGSKCCQRTNFLNSLEGLIDPLFMEHFSENKTRDAKLLPAIEKKLSSSSYSLQFHGDTPERIGIYQSIIKNSIPVFMDKVTPPLHLKNWKNIGVELWKNDDKKNTLLRLPMHTNNTHKDGVYVTWFTKEFLKLFVENINFLFTI
tara:strand:- start:3973 stop:5778 length:1806 start_codon:yes stop_codon:yes gene_type:complete